MGRGRVIDGIDQRSSSNCPALLDGLPHGGQRRVAARGKWHIVETGNTDIIWNTQTCFSHRPDGANSHRITGDKNHFGPASQQPLHRYITANLREISFGDYGFFNRQTILA